MPSLLLFSNGSFFWFFFLSLWICEQDIVNSQSNEDAGTSENAPSARLSLLLTATLERQSMFMASSGLPTLIPCHHSNTVIFACSNICNNKSWRCLFIFTSYYNFLWGQAGEAWCFMWCGLRLSCLCGLASLCDVTAGTDFMLWACQRWVFFIKFQHGISAFVRM